MAIPKVGFMSTFANSQLLEAGARTGFDSVMVGSGIGAGVGAVNGSFSDYEGVFSGAMKGAVIGGIGGAGLKMAGSKYADNYAKKVSQFSDAQNSVKSPTFKLDHLGFDTKLFGKSFGEMSEDSSAFSDSFSSGLNSMQSAARKMYDNDKMATQMATSKFGSVSSPMRGAPYSNNNYTGANPL